MRYLREHASWTVFVAVSFSLVWMRSSIAGPNEDLKIPVKELIASKTTLPEILSKLAVEYRIRVALELKRGHTFGVYSDPGIELSQVIASELPSFDIKIHDGTVYDVFQSVIRANPDYEMRVVRGFVHVMPKDGLEDKRNPLNGALAGFSTARLKDDGRSPDLMGALDQLRHAVEKQGRKAPTIQVGLEGGMGIRHGWRMGQALPEGVEVGLSGSCTVREVVNAILEQTPGAFWTYDPDENGGTVLVGSWPRAELGRMDDTELAGLMLCRPEGQALFAREFLMSRTVDFAALDSRLPVLRNKFVFMAVKKADRQAVVYLRKVGEESPKDAVRVAGCLDQAAGADGKLSDELEVMLVRLEHHKDAQVRRSAEISRHALNGIRARFLGSRADAESVRELLQIASRSVNKGLVAQALLQIAGQLGADTPAKRLKGHVLKFDFAHETLEGIMARMAEATGMGYSVAPELQPRLKQDLRCIGLFSGDAARLTEVVCDVDRTLLVYEGKLQLVSPSRAIDLLSQWLREKTKLFEK